MSLPSFPPDAPSFADGRFVLVSRIGAGSVGSVYRGYDRKQRGWRAFKVLTSAQAGAAERFTAAAEAFATVAHPNVVRVYEVGEVRGQPFAVMELVTGGTLAAWTERHGAMPAGLACGTALELARGLAALHAEGVLHGSLHPRNGLVTPSGVRKLADAGLGVANVDVADGIRTDLRDLGQLVGALVEGGPVEAPLAWIIGECGEALDSADAVADALEAILGELPAEPPGTPDPVIDLSGLEVPLRPGNHPELAELVALPPKPAPAPPPARRQRIPDPGDYDDGEALVDPAALGPPRAERPEGASEVPAAPRRAPSAAEADPEDEADADTVAAGPEPASEVEWDHTEEVERAEAALVSPETPAPLERARRPGVVVGGPHPAPEPRGSSAPAPAPGFPALDGPLGPGFPALDGPGADPAEGGAPEPDDRRRDSPSRASWRGRPPIPHARPQASDEGATPPASGRSAVGCVKLLLVPAALTAGVALLIVILVVVTIGSGAFEVSRAQQEVDATTDRLLTVIDQNRFVVDRLVAIGADRAPLERHLDAYLEHRGGQHQVAAAVALLEVLEREASPLLDERTVSVDRMELNHQVRSLRAAHHRYDQAVASWEAAGETWRGAAAVTLGLATPAPPGTP
jgi:tRNA A-37 threonylcarbamoyl transferase component Bud32